MSNSAELVSNATAGDRDALNILLERSGPAIHRRLHSEIPQRWRSVLSADDVMQETYTDAFIDIGSFTLNGDDAFDRWLATIAKNNLTGAINMLAAEKRGGLRRRVEPGREDDSYVALSDMLASTTTSPSGKAARAEARRAMEQCITQLPEDYRITVLLYDIEGQPAADVAVALQRSPGAVFMLRARAHRVLRKILGAPSKFFSDSP